MTARRRALDGFLEPPPAAMPEHRVSAATALRRELGWFVDPASREHRVSGMTVLQRELGWFVEPASRAHRVSGMTVLQRALGWFVEPASPASGRAEPAPRPAATAAVLGRPGEAEPVAAALALQLRRSESAPAAIVAVLSPPEPGPPQPDSPADGPPADAPAPSTTMRARYTPPVPGVSKRERDRWEGGAAVAPPARPREFLAPRVTSSERAARGGAGADPERSSTGSPRTTVGGPATAAARRLVARLDSRGLVAEPRGRLAWVRLPDTISHACAGARRAAAIGVPTVLAITAPRCPEMDALLREQELIVLVTADPTGPLASLALEGLHGAATVRPLPAGPLRTLATGGLGAGRAGRALTALATGVRREAAW